mmetsp:Transcript_39883/g.66184  ORF Transcript_39883/g.66184 Transcript_39883/m.66184 type:complete len:87 (+) Transcript_39883:1-261(+)
MHDTYGRAVANCVEGVRLGMVHMDAAVGGCGGCPFAPGAAGNLATSDLLKLLANEGIAHGIDAALLNLTQSNLESALQRSLMRPVV